MKQKILEKAGQQLLAGDFDKLNFSTIADELNTTRANLHYHFKNKENLANEVFSQYEKRTVAHYDALKKKFADDIFGFFKEVGNSIWENPEPNKDNEKAVIIGLISDTNLPEKIEEMSRDLYYHIEKIFTEVIQDGINNNEIRKDIEAKKEAIRAHVIMMGIVTSGQYFQCNDKSKERLFGFLADWANSLKQN